VSGWTEAITRWCSSAHLDCTRLGIGHIEPDELGFSEVIGRVNALLVVIPQQEQRARGIPSVRARVVGASVDLIATAGQSARGRI
jgi:hypothetical protein